MVDSSSEEADEGVEGGARRGEKRMNVPISQKGGNTEKTAVGDF